MWDVGIHYVYKTFLVEKFLKEFSEIEDAKIGDNKSYDLRECAPGVLILNATPFGVDAVELEFCDDKLLDKKKIFLPAKRNKVNFITHKIMFDLFYL